MSDWEFWSECNAYAWYAVGFEGVETVESIAVRWADQYADQYKVAISNVPDPVVPHPDSADWTFVRNYGCGDENPGGDGGDDEIQFEGPTDLRWVAVLMYENPEGPNTDERFRLTELELWGAEEPTIAPPVAPTCDNRP
jgi:hypothetical protein